MKEHPGVYTDIAFHRAPMEDPQKENLYFTRLAEYLRDHRLDVVREILIRLIRDPLMLRSPYEHLATAAWAKQKGEWESCGKLFIQPAC